MIMKKSGVSLLEVLIVVVILSVISRIIFGTMNSARFGLGAANNQIDSHQEARRAIDRMTDELRMSSPDWLVGATHRLITISNNGKRLDFYLPTFNTNNEITQLIAVRYYIGGTDNAQLLRKQTNGVTVVASDIDITAIQANPIFVFGNAEKSVINIRVPIIKQDTGFVLTSQVNLRNQQVLLGGGVQIAGIIE